MNHSFQVAAKGNIQEFERLYDADNSRLNIQDSKGNTPAHRAAENGRVNILEFIVYHCGGEYLPIILIHSSGLIYLCQTNESFLSI